jgi:hypothetical protein
VVRAVRRPIRLGSLGVYRCAPAIFVENVLRAVGNRRPPGSASFTLKKLECSKQACAMNTLAWNNNLGLPSYFVGF